MSGLDNMKMRVQSAGGDADGRLAKGKLKSLQSALKNSYQAEWITLNDKVYRCLMNPDNLKKDYDQKTLSIEYSSGIKEGDVFEWNRTGTHWISYLQELSEDAYYRSEVRRCSYTIDVNGTPYWIYLRGPVETDIVWGQKSQIAFNKPIL